MLKSVQGILGKENYKAISLKQMQKSSTNINKMILASFQRWYQGPVRFKNVELG